MRRSVIRPLDRPFARAIAVETPEYRRVILSGAAAVDDDGNVVGEGDIRKQTEYTFERIAENLAEVGGELSDIVITRVYVNDELTDEQYDAINEIRHEQFPSPEEYPASTLVAVENLVSEDLLIEIEAEAIVPADEWETEIVE